jgi:hypothetical protein
MSTESLSKDEKDTSENSETKNENKLTFFQRIGKIQNQIACGIKFVSSTTDWVAKKSIDFVHGVEHVSHDYGNIDNDLLQISEKINNQYKYESMLLRTHGTAIKFTGVAIVTYASSYLGRRIMLLGAVSSYIMSSASIYLVEYKWKK